jgi:hypothetical protein
MSDVKLVFIPSSVGAGKGNYEMFIDLDSSSAPSNLIFDLPVLWSAMAIKVYPVSRNAQGKMIPNPDKQSNMGILNSGNLAQYINVFGPSYALPAGFSFVPGVSQLTMTAATTGEYEFLLWIQDVSGDNDYIDPGIKNHD